MHSCRENLGVHLIKVYSFDADLVWFAGDNDWHRKHERSNVSLRMHYLDESSRYLTIWPSKKVV